MKNTNSLAKRHGEGQQNHRAVNTATRRLRRADARFDTNALWVHGGARSRLLESVGELTFADLIDAGTA